jgi:hypothetical protein
MGSSGFVDWKHRFDVIAALKASFKSCGMNSRTFNGLPASLNRIIHPAAYHVINNPLTLPLELSSCINGIFQSFV